MTFRTSFLAVVFVTLLLATVFNAQFGNEGCVIAVEYGFYVSFTRCLVGIVTALVAEKQRLAGKPTACFWRAPAIARLTFVRFFLTVRIFLTKHGGRDDGGRNAVLLVLL